MSYAHKLTIDYKKWGRSALVRDDGKMCCLGFYGKACGVSDSVMIGAGMPWSTPGDNWPKWALNDANSSAPNRLAQINDDSKIPQYKKMAAITKIFKNNKVDVKWINVPPNTMEAFKRLMKSKNKGAK